MKQAEEKTGVAQIAELIEKAREYLYTGGLHHQGKFTVMFESGGCIDLAETLAFWEIKSHAHLLEVNRRLLDTLKEVIADGRIRSHEPLGVDIRAAIALAEKG